MAGTNKAALPEIESPQARVREGEGLGVMLESWVEAEVMVD